jgi:hypothetical protein
MAGIKEQIYDAQVAPMMAQIIAICKENKIAMLADFALDDDLKCMTALLSEEFAPSENQLKALQLLSPRRSFVMAETIETKPDGTQHISLRRIS